MRLATILLPMFLILVSTASVFFASGPQAVEPSAEQKALQFPGPLGVSAAGPSECCDSKEKQPLRTGDDHIMFALDL